MYKAYCDRCGEEAFDDGNCRGGLYIVSMQIVEPNGVPYTWTPPRDVSAVCKTCHAEILSVIKARPGSVVYVHPAFNQIRLKTRTVESRLDWLTGKVAVILARLKKLDGRDE